MASQVAHIRAMGWSGFPLHLVRKIGLDQFAGGDSSSARTT